MTYKPGWRKFSLEGEEIWLDNKEPNPWYSSPTEVNSVDLYTSCNRYKLELGFGTYNMSSDYSQSSSSDEVVILRRRVYRVLKDTDVGKQVRVEADEVSINPGRPAKAYNSYLVRLTLELRSTEHQVGVITQEDVGKSLIVGVDYLQPDYPQIRIDYD